MFFSLPNLLTYFRIVVIPVLMVMMMVQGDHRTLLFNQWMGFFSALLFILAGITDVIDGHLARKYGQVSIIGKFLDPMADKLIMMAVMVLMIPMGRLPAWLVVLLLFRETLITGLRSVAAGEGIIIDADKLGKKKTICFNIGLSALLIYYPLPYLHTSAYTVGWFAMILGSVLSLISGYFYMSRFFKEMSQKNKL
ncbi:CDP-diacylglycerol--glycerol-3-phosphate 3-phosphatidyltransferase [bacterium]|nr:CDP-diacylglycerol--glycerol-3-phosphate 3-phosphatidyltransferase [bacterium]